MEKANKFFFLENVNDNVNCDFNRQGEKTMLVFCHENDSEQTDRLTVLIRTENSIQSHSGKLENRHFIAYTLERSGVTIKQADSLPITTPDLVWMFTTAIVNDVFRAN